MITPLWSDTAGRWSCDIRGEGTIFSPTPKFVESNLAQNFALLSPRRRRLGGGSGVYFGCRRAGPRAAVPWWTWGTRRRAMPEGGPGAGNRAGPWQSPRPHVAGYGGGGWVTRLGKAPRLGGKKPAKNEMLRLKFIDLCLKLV